MSKTKTHSKAKAHDETLDSSQAGEGLSVDALLQLREDKRGLKAFIEDFAEAQDKRRLETRKQIEKSAIERLKLAEEIDESKLDEDEKLDKEDELNEHGSEFADELFDLLEDEDLDENEKLKRIDELLAKFQERVNRKEKERERKRGLLERFNGAKTAFLAFLVGFPLFKALSPSLQEKIQAKASDPKIDEAQIADFASKLIKEHTGEEVDLSEIMLAEMLANPKKDAEAQPEGEEPEQGMLDYAMGIKKRIDSNHEVAAYRLFEKECGIPKMVLASVSTDTIGHLRAKVKGLTFEDMRDEFDSEADAQAAWEYTQKLQTLVDWVDDNSDEISDLLAEEIENLEGVSKDEAEELKALTDVDNLMVSQIAVAMFGDNDLSKGWLTKGAAYIDRSLRFYKSVCGSDAVLAKSLVGYYANTNLLKQRFEARSSMRRLAGDLKLSSGLELKGRKELANHFEELNKEIDSVNFGDKSKMSAEDLSQRNKLVDTFHDGVKTSEKRFNAISGELYAKGQILDTVAAKGGLAGKTLNDLGLDAKSRKVFEDLLGSGAMSKSAKEAMEEAQHVFMRRTKDLLEYQRDLNKVIGKVQTRLVTDVLEPFEHLSKATGRVLTGQAKSGVKLGDVAKSWSGKIKHFGPKLALPTFGVGMAVVDGIRGQQGFKKTALMVSEAALSFVPFVGAAMDIGLGIKGYDLAGNKLGTWERVSYVGFGAVGAVADFFGGFLVRGAMAAVVKGRRGAKIVSSIGRRKSVILKGFDAGRKITDSFSVVRRAEKLEAGIIQKRKIIGDIVSRQANGFASKWETMWRLPSLRKQVAKAEKTLESMKGAVTMSKASKHARRASRLGAMKHVGYGDRILSVMEKAGAAAGLAWLITKGNVTPVDVAKGAGTGLAYAGDAVGYGYETLYDNVGPSKRAAHDVVAAYLAEKRLEQTIRDKEDDLMGAVAEHADSPEARVLMARSGIPAYEFAGGDSKGKTFASFV